MSWPVRAVAALAVLGACSDSGVVSTSTTSASGGAGGAGGTATEGGATSVGNGGDSTGGSSPYTDSWTVSGVIVDENGEPVPSATVVQGGAPDTAVLTGADGSFTIQCRLVVAPTPPAIPALVAYKKDHRAQGMEMFDSGPGPVSITIHSATLADNLAYLYQDPGDGIDNMQENCTHCHQKFVVDFLSSKHAEAARDPLVQDLYLGVTRGAASESACIAIGGEWKLGHAPGTTTPALACYVGGGVLPDLNTTCGNTGEPACDDPTIAPALAPQAFGACADCHAPGIDGVAGGRDLQDAVGLAYDIGVHCDPCHKVRDVDLTKPPGIGQRLELRRPNEPGSGEFAFMPLFYGPIPDVPIPFMRAVEQPKFNEAVFCAGCHQQNQPALVPGDSLDTTRWPNGLPVHSTYDEWLAGPYNDAETPCQHCHMPADATATNANDHATFENQSIPFGFPRAPEDIRRHIFRSPFQGDPRLIDTALFTSLALEVAANQLTVAVSITNVGCGHAVPTGEPLRSLVLVVEGEGDCGALTPVGGLTINDVGGSVAEGAVGTDALVAGNTVTWADGAAVASAGQVLRIVRPTGVFDDYVGVGFFGEAGLTPSEKGMPVREPVATATIVSVVGNDITVDAPVTTLAGDIVYLGDPAPSMWADGQAAKNLAGAAGYTFARVLTDSASARSVPHYRAVDMASDNRIPPGQSARTSHRFDVTGCTQATVKARLLYRPVPTHMARLFGWTASDFIISAAEESVGVP